MLCIGNPSLTSGEAEFNSPNPDSTHGTTTVFTGTHPLLFADNFTTDLGWINRSNGYIFRDVENERLNWRVSRRDNRRFFIPINAASDSIRLSFRFKVTNYQGSLGLFVGLLEELTGAVHYAVSYPLGFFVGFGHHSANIEMASQLITHANHPKEGIIVPCGEMSCADPATYVTLDEVNSWQRMEIAIQGKEWSITVFDDGGSQLDRLTGTMHANHSRYQYLMFMYSRSGGPDWISGYIDDIQVYGQALPTYDARGRVVNGNDEPLSNIMVTAGEYISTTTDARGLYTLTNLISDTYTIQPIEEEVTFVPGNYSAALPPSRMDLDFVGTRSTDGRIQVSPAEIKVNLDQGGRINLPLRITNVGGGDLALSVIKGATPTDRVMSSMMQPLSWPTQKVDESLRRVAEQNTNQTMLVYLKKQADLADISQIPGWVDRGRQLYGHLWTTAQGSQADLITWLEEQKAAGTVDSYHSFFILNAVAVTGDSELIAQLAERQDVAHVGDPQILQMPDAPSQTHVNASICMTNSVAWGVRQIGADRVWDEKKYKGRGVVVGLIDTGVEQSHPALVGQYRKHPKQGSPGSKEYHNYNWYDATGKSTEEPIDDSSGHGTHVLGTIVGSANGAQIGVAPKAEWIAVKACDEGLCRTIDLLKAAEWLLAPCPIGAEPGHSDCDPGLRPRIINNSWGDSTDSLAFRSIVSVWRASGMLPVFAAGNYGRQARSAGSLASPADHPAAFAVGAVNTQTEIAGFSSTGPSIWTREIKPDVVAPGVEICSAEAGGSYVEKSGTSMASPHVAGAAALLLEAKPTLKPAEIENLLKFTAVDLDSNGPDYTYGYGLINVFAALTFTGEESIWLSPDKTTATLVPGEHIEINIALNATAMIGREYNASIQIHSNDPEQPLVTVPVTLWVKEDIIRISEPKISNVTASSATITWFTDQKTAGKVYYEEIPRFPGNPVLQVGGPESKTNVHVVVLTNLRSNREHIFYTDSGGNVDNNGGRYYTFRTGAFLPAREPDEIRGRILQDDGSSAVNIPVFLTIFDGDGRGHLGESALISTLTDESGLWQLPFEHLSNHRVTIRTQDGQQKYVSSSSGDFIDVEAHGGYLCQGRQWIQVSAANPATDIQLSCSLNVPDQGEPIQVGPNQDHQIEVTTDWQILQLSSFPEAPYRASNLAADAQIHNGAIAAISQWNSEEQSWRIWSSSTITDDFELTTTQPIFIRGQMPHLLSLPTSTDIGVPPPISLKRGGNFIKFSGQLGQVTAGQACAQIEAQGGMATVIARWHLDRWVVHSCSQPESAGFPLSLEQGYFIQSTTDSMWEPKAGTLQAAAEPVRPLAIPILESNSSVEVSNLHFTNVGSNSLVVTWQTAEPYNGTIRFGSEPNGLVNQSELISDEGKHLHRAELSRLAPETAYYVDVQDRANVDIDSGQLYSVTTGTMLDIPTVDGFYGRVLYDDGSPAVGSMIKLHVEDVDGLGSPQESAILSAWVGMQGYWSVNLGGVRTTVGEGYYSYSPEDWIVLNVTASTGEQSTEMFKRQSMEEGLELVFATSEPDTIFLPLISQ